MGRLVGKSRKTRRVQGKPEDEVGTKPEPGKDDGPAAEAEGDEPGGGGRRFPIVTLGEVALALAVFAVLLLLVHWLAAVSIASALFVFLDATVNHVYRLKPSSEESRSALVFWSVAGFVPFAGVGVYLVMRRKLAAALVGDAATGREAVEAVRSRMGAVPVPAAVVVGLIALGLALLGLRLPDGFTLEFGTGFTGALGIEGSTPDNALPIGRISVRLESDEPLGGYADLDWRLFLIGSGDEPIDTGTVRVQPRSNNTLWVWRVGVRHPGDYRLDTVDSAGAPVKSGCFTAVRRRR